MKKGYIAIMLAVVPWGLSFLNTKIALKALDPMTLCFVRFFIALIIVGVIGLVTGKSFKIKRKDIKYFLLAGGVGITVYFYFENNGVKYIDPSAASMILASLPIATIFGESLFDQRSLNKKMIFGGIISLIGVGIIISSDLSLEAFLDSDAFLGYMMMFLAIGAWIVYSLSTKILFDKYEQYTIVFYQFVFGTLLAIPFMLLERPDFYLVNQETVINVLMLGVFSSAIGFFAYNYAMKHIGVSKSSLFVNFIPLVTIIASYFYYGTFIGVRQLLGGALIIFSVLMNSREKEIIEVNDHRSLVE